jgi:hypothetical protein
MTWTRWLAAFSLAAGLAGGARAATMPKVMVLVEEKSLGTVATSEIEAMAVRLLGDRQIETVDQDMVRANLQRVQQAMKGAGDDRGAAALGREFGADVIVVGDAVAKPAARRIGESNLRAYQAAVTLRAVRTDNSVNLASASEDVSVVALDDVSGGAKSLKAAGQKALDVLIPAMIEKWEKSAPPAAAGAAAAGGGNLDITVGGVDQVWKLKAIRESLRARKEAVDGVTQRSYAQGLAIFRVASRLPAEELAEALVMKPPEGLKMQVIEVTPAALNLRAVEAP